MDSNKRKNSVNKWAEGAEVYNMKELSNDISHEGRKSYASSRMKRGGGLKQRAETAAPYRVTPLVKKVRYNGFRYLGAS